MYGVVCAPVFVIEVELDSVLAIVERASLPRAQL